MLTARMVTTALVQKGSQVHLFVFTLAFTFSDQKKMSSYPVQSISISLLYITSVDMDVLDSLGPPIFFRLPVSVASEEFAKGFAYYYYY